MDRPSPHVVTAPSDLDTWGENAPGGRLSHRNAHVSPARTAVSGRPGLSPDALRCSGEWQKAGPWFEDSGPLTGG